MKDKIMAIRFIFQLLIIMFLISGCGTVYTLGYIAEPEARSKTFRVNNNTCELCVKSLSIPYVYSGTKLDYIKMFYPMYFDWAHGEVGVLNNAIFILAEPFYLADMFLSFGADTVLLPYTMYKQITDGYLIDPPYFQMSGHCAEKNCRNILNSEHLDNVEKGISVLHKYEVSEEEENVTFCNFYDECYELAVYYMAKGEYKKSISLYERFIECEKRHKDKSKLAEYYYMIEKSYSALGDYENAKEYGNRISNEDRNKMDKRFGSSNSNTPSIIIKKNGVYIMGDTPDSPAVKQMNPDK